MTETMAATAAEELLARREQLWLLRESTMDARPALGWQAFFADLWEAIDFPGKTRLRVGAPLGPSDALEIRDDFSSLRVDRGTTAAALEMAREPGVEDGRVRVADGMISLVRRRCSHVIAVVDELKLLDPGWLDVVVCALQWAAWQGAEPEEMRDGLMRCCLGPGQFEEIGERGGLRFLNGYGFRSQQEANRALRWSAEPALVVLGGGFILLDSRLEETLIAGGSTLIHLMDLPRSQRGILRRYVDVYAVPSMEAALRKVLALSEGEKTVICFPAIGCGEVEALKLGSKWAAAVTERK